MLSVTWDFFHISCFPLIFLTYHSSRGCKQLNNLCYAFDSNVRQHSCSFVFEKLLRFCLWLFIIFFHLLILTLVHPLWKQSWKLSFDVLRTCSCLLNKWLRVSYDVRIIAGHRKPFQTGFVKHVLARFDFTVHWDSSVGTWSEIAGAGSPCLLCSLHPWVKAFLLLLHEEGMHRSSKKEYVLACICKKKMQFLQAFCLGLVIKWSSLCYLMCFGSKEVPLLSALLLFLWQKWGEAVALSWNV